MPLDLAAWEAKPCVKDKARGLRVSTIVASRFGHVASPRQP
jgi:hypothetical protein